MKRIVIIAFLFGGLAAVSCSKETIRPTAETSQEIPTWRSAEEPDDETAGETGVGAITDPNNDKDETTRRRN